MTIKESEGYEDSIYLKWEKNDLKMGKKKAVSQEMWIASRNWKDKETDSTLNFWKECNPAYTLIEAQ